MLTKKTNNTKRTIRVRISEADWSRYEKIKKRAAALGYETQLDDVLARVVKREVAKAEKTLDAAEDESNPQPEDPPGHTNDAGHRY